MATGTQQTPKLTAKGERTRARIVEAAAKLIYEHGVAATTVEDVKEVAGVSSSQLYHYFADKEALVQAVIDRQADFLVGNQQRMGLDTPERLRAWRDLVVAKAGHAEGKGGCPLGSLGSQVAETDEQARTHVAVGFGHWSAAIGDGLRALHDAGHLAPGVDPDALAVTLLATLQGGLLLAQVERDDRTLAIALDTLLALATGSAVSLGDRLGRRAASGIIGESDHGMTGAHEPGTLAEFPAPDTAPGGTGA
jgi:TetR/AcrR family transcriptional regulator, transcriptional repressor for nem operon